MLTEHFENITFEEIPKIIKRSEFSKEKEVFDCEKHLKIS